ncbi:MAG: hypothetical protein R3301_01385 [Saprospiraceae bacterium]|nr:hypothetical protein [Saprospiraceae bacterium]
MIIDAVSATFGVLTVSEFPAIDKMLIDSNHIESEMTGAGVQIHILADQQDNFKVTKNTIETSSSSFAQGRYGIALESVVNGIGHEVNHNDVDGTTTGQTLQCAIHIEDSPNVSLCDNHTDLSKRGVHLAGNNMPLEMRSSDIDVHERGLYLTGSVGSPMPWNGDQRRFDNRWSTNQSHYSEHAAECESNSENNFFWVQNSNTDILPPNRDPLLDLWFKVETGTINACQTPATPIDGRITAWDTLLMDDELFDTTYSDASQWIAKKEFMYKLMRIDSLRPTNSKMDTFYNDHIDSSYAKHAAVELLYFEAMELSDSLQTLVDSTHDLIQDALEELLLVDTSQTKTIDTLNLDSTALNSATTWIDSIKVLSDSLDNHHSEITRLQDDLLSSAIDSLTDLPKNEQHEEDNYWLLQIRLKRALNDSITSVQYDTLKSIASRDAGEFGRTVLLARAFIYPCSDPGFLDGADTVSAGQSAITSSETADVTSNEWSVVSNPTSGECSIVWDQRASGYLLITDVNGKAVANRPVRDALTQRFSLQGLPAGTYFVIFRNTTGITSSQKLILTE